MQFSIPDWVPASARSKIIEYHSRAGTDPEIINFLRRLATYPAMRTEVWQKLPSGNEANIIDWAYCAFTFFPQIPRPLPRIKTKLHAWAVHRQKNIPFPDVSLAGDLASLLWIKISELKPMTDSDWHRLWQGEKSVTPDQILRTLEQLSTFYHRMHQEHQAFLDSLPKLKQYNSPAAGQKFFTQYVSKCIVKTTGRPLDSIVAALTEVAFDLSAGLGAETVRGRRRLNDAPEKM